MRFEVGKMAVKQKKGAFMMQKKGTFTKQNKGFSLVEIIIVIAIMAVLLAVLTPQYLKYIEKSKQNSDAEAFAEVVSAVEKAAVDPANKVTGSMTLVWDGSTYTLSGSQSASVQAETNRVINGDTSDNSLKAKSKLFSEGDTVTFTYSSDNWSKQSTEDGPFHDFVNY